MKINCAKKLGPLLQKPKRIKIIVGGRGSTKSTFAADYVLACMSQGQLWCCSREFQNSLDESVHRLLEDEIERLGFAGFTSSATNLTHSSGGRNFYRGLARNVTSVKSMLSGVDGLWIEEGESLSDSTLRVLTASVRLSALDSERLIAGEDVKMPEIWITMNRGSIADPVSKKWLKRAERDLERCGYYEDDMIMVVEVNYDDIPKSWFNASGLEQERQDDLENLSRAQYDHKWHGKYLEVVENSIIAPEWFDACIDAHVKLGFQALGQERIAYDPADSGDDKAICYIHGSVVKDVVSTSSGDVNSATDWATFYAAERKPDAFTWDADGMGMGLKQQIYDTLGQKRLIIEAFRGSEGADDPDMIYQRVDSEIKSPKTNKETFANKRAQYYWTLRDRMLKTYKAVKDGKMYNPDELISFSSEIDELDALKAEVCRIPRKPAGRIQLLSKPEMKRLGIQSPNRADALMMCMRPIEVRKKKRGNGFVDAHSANYNPMKW